MTQVRNYLALDLLRGLAALAVFLCHIRGASFVEYGALPPHQHTLLIATFFALTRLGHEAVMVFFVLSGFLVGRQIINRAQSGQFDLTTYAIDRTTRIFVPLLPACALTAAISLIAFGNLPGWPQIAANLTGLNNIVTGTLPQNAPLWSLAYEIWFYVFAGAIGYTLSTNAVHPASLLAVACAVAIVSASSPFYLLFWCIGAAAVFAMQYRFKTLLAISGIFLFTAGCICYELAVQSRSITSINLLPLPVSEAFICIGIALAIPKLCTDKANAALKPVRRAIIGLSAMSYSLYLVHYPLNCALNLWLPKAAFLSPQSIAALFFRTALVFAGCLVFYFCFEVHTKLVRRIFQHTPLTETGESRAIN